MSHRPLSVSDAPRELPEKAQRMATAALRLAEKRDFQAEIGGCLAKARHWLGWSLKESAGHLGRDERQVARWENGQERTQVDVVFGVPELRAPFVVALAALAECEVETVVRIRRTA